MDLHLKAKHFSSAPYFSFDKSPIAKAYLEHTGTPCIEGVNLLIEKGEVNKKFEFDAYSYPTYLEDYAAASEKSFDETLIRIISLRLIKNGSFNAESD